MKLQTKIITISFLQWIFVIVAAAFILQESQYIWFDIIGCILYLIIAAICEWLKYCIIHNDKNNE